MGLVQFETRGGVPVTANGYTVTPFARALVIHLPHFPGGLIWNRGVSVHVLAPDGKEEIQPIHDITRLVQVNLAVASLLTMAIIWIVFRKK